MKEELIGLIPAAGRGVRLGLPYPKELYPVIRNNHYKPISQFVLDNILLEKLTSKPAYFSPAPPNPLYLLSNTFETDPDSPKPKTEDLTLASLR